MMETLLFNTLLFLGVVWVILGIAYLWSLFQGLNIKPRKDAEEMKAGKQSKSLNPSVSQEQIDSARHILVGRSKPFISPSVPDVPAVSSTENPADNPNTFAAENSPVPEETEDTGGTGEENEMQIDYTMDEPDEDIIAREELQIADAAMPEVSPSAILARDIIRVNGWHRNDDTLDEENEAEVHETLQSIRGTQLMDYIKEATLKQEQDHQKLLAAIRKVEEAELQENDTKMTSAPGTDKENNNEGTTEEKPLSYYL